MRLAAVPDQPPRAVAYIRVSKEGGRGDELMSPAIQLTAIRDHCARRGYELTEVLEDIDRTGTLWRGRQMETAVQMVEDGRCAVIVVWKGSRVSRNRRDWAIAVDRVETAGGQLESATEPMDTSTSTGRFTRGMLAELAAFESERIGESWREVHRQRAAAGLPHYAPPRLGYRYTRGQGYAIDPDGAETVTEMYRRYTAGESVAAVRDWLAAEGVSVPKSGAKYWTRNGVQAFLDSGFAAGLLRRHDPACKCGKPRGTSCGRWVHDEGSHQPIITGGQWAAFRAARASRATVQSRAQAARTRLSGLVLCAGCGGPMYLHGSHGDDQYGYLCRRNLSRPGRCASPAWIRRVDCEQAVRQWLPEVAALIEDQVVRLPPPAVSKQRRDRLERKIVDDDAALVRLTMDRVRLALPESAFNATRDALVAEQEKARQELAAIPAAADLELFTTAAGELLETWESAPTASINRVLRNLLRVNASTGQPPTVVPVWVGLS